VHEFLYPIFQAYDMVTMDADMQIGGNDQTFNMLAGRTLMKKMKNKEAFVLTTKLLVDPTGRKMGKTEGNLVRLDEKPKEMYGKIMSWPDTLINPGFELCTFSSLEEIKKINNPREAKARLAREIVSFYHGEVKALRAEQEFNKVFKEKKTPSQIKILKITPCSLGAKELLVKCGFSQSLSEAQRLIEQGAVSLDNKILEDWRQKIQIRKPAILKVGKHRFLKIIP
jgi:tyrosyl-tRNA synthetase